MRVWRILTIALVIAMITAFGATLRGETPAAAEPTPPYDSFYNPPANWQKAQPGAILRSRPVHAKALQIFPINVRAWQLLYRSTGEHGEPDAAVTTLLLPAGPARPRPLLSYQSATDSVGRQCNPSYGLIRGLPIDPTSTAGPMPLPTAAAEVAFAFAGLQQGWAVAMPDHGGVNNRFLTPKQPGYAVLDGIRAVESFRPAGLAGRSTPVGLWGYSGGGIASSWTAEMQPSYAPELNIVGAAMGAAERSLDMSVRTVNGTPLAGLIPLALGAVLKDQPELLPTFRQYFTARGVADIQSTRNACMPQNVLRFLWYDINRYLKVPLNTALEDPVVKAALTTRGISGKVPTAPVYVYNGVTEEVGPIAGADNMVRSYCAGGASVTYRREALPPRPLPQLMTTHGVVAVTGAPGALHWLKERLSQRIPARPGCDVKTVPSTMITPEGLSELGPIVSSFLIGTLGLPLGQ